MTARLTSWALAAAIATLALGCGGPPGADEARAHIERRDYGRAEEAAARGLEKAPRSRELWALRIRAALERGDSARAAALYREMTARRDAPAPGVLAGMARTTLRQALGAPSAAVRARAVAIAERHEIEPLAREVVARLGDGDDRVRAAAAVAVIRAHPDAPRIATRMLDSRDPRARAIAVRGIGRKIGARARSDLVPALDDPDPAVRRAAATAIGALESARDTARLVDIARGDDSGRVRAAALRALARGERDGAARVADAALADDYLGARLAAVAVLNARGAYGPLARVAASDDLAVALRAAALLRRAGAGGRGGLSRALAAGDPGIRAAALAQVPRAMDRRAALRAAAARLPDPEPTVRLAAARALLRLGVRRRAVRELTDALASGRAAIRVRAAAELARLGDRRGKVALAEFASHRDASVRRRAIAGHRTAGVVTAGLADALADRSAELRLAATEAVLALDGSS